jgi:anaerobic magnesium-protoporphyrin IX monomethyl ester cyclase
MVKRLEGEKIRTAFRNMRDAGVKSFAFFIFGYPGESLATIDQTIDYAIELNPDFANFYPAVPYPGTPLHEKVVREGLLPAGADEDWSRLEYSYYVLEGNGLNHATVMNAINRAKRRFFLRPAYLASHAGDIVRLAMTKWRVASQIAARMVFGTKVVDPAPASPPPLGLEASGRNAVR